MPLIEDQRATNDRQLKTTVREANRSIPLLDQTRPLVDQTTEALPAVLGEVRARRSRRHPAADRYAKPPPGTAQA